LENFFKKIFDFDYADRVTIKQIKNDRLVKGYFQTKVDSDLLEVIGEENSIIESALMSKKLDLRCMKFWNLLLK
jgi:hypothetical protein